MCSEPAANRFCIEMLMTKKMLVIEWNFLLALCSCIKKYSSIKQRLWSKSTSSSSWKDVLKHFREIEIILAPPATSPWFRCWFYVNISSLVSRRKGFFVFFCPEGSVRFCVFNSSFYFSRYGHEYFLYIGCVFHRGL